MTISIRRTATHAGLVSSLALACTESLVAAAGLNDTGQTQCYDTSGIAGPCSASVGGDAAANPRQDARYGRDAQNALGAVTKVGVGAAGFDFTKIANDGSFVSADAVIGSGPKDWACTRDNVTGLVWEVKTTSGLRSRSHVYTWYSTSGTNGGNAGALGTNTCGNSLAAASYNNQCNTQNYVAAVNQVGLCGASDWRLPTRRESLTLVHAGATASPHIDTSFFPDTTPTNWWTWTGSTAAINPTFAWYIDFYDGNSYASSKTTSGYVIRLVR